MIAKRQPTAVKKRRYTYRTWPSGRKAKKRKIPFGSAQGGKQRTSAKFGDLSEYLGLSHIRTALRVIQYRLNRKDVRTAKYVLELCFGRVAVGSLLPARELVEEKEEGAVMLTDEYLDQLAAKYLPMPKGWTGGHPDKELRDTKNVEAGGQNSSA